MCHFVLCFSVLLVLRLPRLGKRANLSAFRTFVRFVLVWICLFPLPLGVWEGLQFVIVALPGLFSYFFFFFIIGQPVYLKKYNFVELTLQYEGTESETMTSDSESESPEARLAKKYRKVRSDSERKIIFLWLISPAD